MYLTHKSILSVNHIPLPGLALPGQRVHQRNHWRLTDVAHQRQLVSDIGDVADRVQDRKSTRLNSSH